jgi:hypothetical protein
MRIGFFILLSLMVLSAGCAPKYGTVTSTEEWSKTPVKSIGLFSAAPETGESESLFRTGRMAAADRVHFLPQIEKVLLEKGYRVRTGDRSEPVPLPVSPEWVMETGKELGTDAILFVVPLDYEEREGGPAGVRKPASVAFELYVFRTRDGLRVWQGAYAETQQALTENLGTFSLFVDRGARWLSAQELLYDGASRLLQSFPQVQAP